QTQTYEVVLSLTPPPDLRVLPGMGVEVLPESASAEGNAAADGTAPVLIPIAAVVAAADGTPTVWVVDPETGQVSRRSIETGALQDAEIAVLSGLRPGERIVTAGVHSLRDGMRVHPLASDSSPASDRSSEGLPESSSRGTSDTTSVSLPGPSSAGSSSPQSGASSAEPSSGDSPSPASKDSPAPTLGL
ncbi:MAG: hypothetical protein VBE63_29495, partial [Lamprobacter sp.]|uniref:efflux RND transporter periplasmic adaptor subunit n=1 Tax=Lamprobacter sp. TaxID=3100796 RepID=UPI002D7DE53F|nr:hypothetical protein [Lamprobacter sp.]